MSIVSHLGPSLTARVIYRSREEAERETGYFEVNAVKVTEDLGSRIASCIHKAYCPSAEYWSWNVRLAAQSSSNAVGMPFPSVGAIGV